MNNIHVVLPGGGPFSRFLQCGVIPLADVDFDNVFLELSPFVENNATDEYSQIAVNYIVHNTRAMAAYGIERPYQHIMGFVTDQKFDETYRYHGFLPVGTWYDRNRPIEHSPRLKD